MYFNIAKLSSALLLLAPAVTSAPITDLVERSKVLVARKGGAFFFVSLAGLAKGEIKQKWMVAPPPSRYMDVGEYKYDAVFNPSDDNPKPWWGAWYPGDNEFLEKDADVAKCILDLHNKQEDVCISVKGSSCDNGYIDGGGQILNIQNFRSGKGLADDDAEGLKSAVDAMIGKKMRTDLTNGHAFGPRVGTTEDADHPSVPSAVYFIRYQGQKEC